MISLLFQGVEYSTISVTSSTIDYDSIEFTVLSYSSPATNKDGMRDASQGSIVGLLAVAYNGT